MDEIIDLIPNGGLIGQSVTRDVEAVYFSAYSYTTAGLKTQNLISTSQSIRQKKKLCV